MFTIELAGWILPHLRMTICTLKKKAKTHCALEELADEVQISHA
jgi:hypothetical protein